MKLVDYLFDQIWEIQLKIIKKKIQIESYCKKENYSKLRAIFTVIYKVFLCIVVLFFVVKECFFPGKVCDKFNSILIILFICFIISLIISKLEWVVDLVYSFFTTIRGFFFFSITINAIFAFVSINWFNIDSVVLSGFIFLIPHSIISVLSNSYIANKANSMIEIILGLFSLTSVGVKYFLYNVMLESNFNSLSASDQTLIMDYYNTITNSWAQRIDYVLFPLLIINGITLLVCMVHSHWVKEYNLGNEITRDINKIEEYSKLD